MSERPILFSGPMVRALLDGTKTQTRRVVRGVPKDAPIVATYYTRDYVEMVGAFAADSGLLAALGRSPVCVGDHLWVRERVWERPERTLRMMREGADTWSPWEYDADQSEGDREQLREWGWRHRPSIHMPRAASRITLIVEAVRYERLHDISEEDAKAEGVGNVARISDLHGRAGPEIVTTYRESFFRLWHKINGDRAPLGMNPWVRVIGFRVCQAGQCEEGSAR